MNWRRVPLVGGLLLLAASVVSWSVFQFVSRVAKSPTATSPTATDQPTDDTASTAVPVPPEPPRRRAERDSFPRRTPLPPEDAVRLGPLILKNQMDATRQIADLQAAYRDLNAEIDRVERGLAIAAARMEAAEERLMDVEWRLTGRREDEFR